MTTFDNRSFRNALGMFATGVTIVTTLDTAGRDVGITANSFNSVSLDPPLVLWSLARSSRSLEAFSSCGRFVVHLLAADQQSLSDRFARSGAHKFAGLAVDRGLSGLALLPGCSAWFQCRTCYQYEGGDHIIFVGEVEQFDAQNRPPLVFHAGRYAVAARKLSPRNTEVATEQPHLEGSYSEDSLHYLVARLAQQMMHALRPQIRRLGCSSDEEYFLLAVLVVGDGRSLEQVNATFPGDGDTITPDVAHALLKKDWVRLRPESGDRLWLTDRGREVVIHGIAANKAFESDLLGMFDYTEAQVLKDMLNRLVGATSLGVPQPFNPAR